MRIATFNLQNLRLLSKPSGPHLEGAHDYDVETSYDPALDVLDRRLTAAVLARINADVVCLQEVYDIAALDFFHEEFLLPTGTAPYPYRLCLPGNDGRGVNVAMISRVRPDRVVSHADARAEDLGLTDSENVLGGEPIFRRDCLEIWFGDLALFLCHLKAPYPDRTRAAAIRSLEVLAIRRIIERSLADPAVALWMILGDLNGPLQKADQVDGGLGPLLNGFAIDLMRRLGQSEAWTFRMPQSGARLRPDAMLASPELAGRLLGVVPTIERAGMDPEAGHRIGGLFASVEDPRPHASDHSAIWIDFDDWAGFDGADAPS